MLLCIQCVACMDFTHTHAHAHARARAQTQTQTHRHRHRHTDTDTHTRAGRPRGRSSSPGREKNFLFFKSSRPALRSTHPPIQWVPGALSPGVKRPGREVDHSPPICTEVKKMWICTSTPHTPSWHSA
jgi:Ni/Co efflux regulator RcnB